MNPKIQFLVAIVSIIGALAAWTAVIVNLYAQRRQRQQWADERRKLDEERAKDRARNMDIRYADLAKQRRNFFQTLRGAHEKFKVSNPDIPDKLEGLIRPDGVPPDLFPRNGRDLKLWPAENETKLNNDQRMLWKFVSQVYPPHLDRTSILFSPEKFELFDEARGELARFWQTYVPTLSMEYLCKRYRSAYDQLLLLPWLEIALGCRLPENAGEGKTELFKLSINMSNTFSS